MISFVFIAEDWYEIQRQDDYEFGCVLETARYDLESLEISIYHAWMGILKRKLQRIAVSAIVGSQILPWIIIDCMSDLLTLLNRIYRAFRGFLIEKSIVTKAITELLKLVAVTVFNDLLLGRSLVSSNAGS